MKHTFLLSVALICLCAGLVACDSRRGSNALAEENFSKDASYALGMNLGSSLKADEVYLNMDEFMKGMIDALKGAETRFTNDEAGMIVHQTFMALMEEREAASMQEGIDFLEENSKKPGIFITESGLQYEIITEGSGPKPVAENMVRVHYEGALTDGTVFDSSYMRDEPIEFPLMAVIPGWSEGVQLMNVGSKYRLYIPSDIGYGPQGAPPMIPPYATLVFEVELLDIVDNENE